MENFKFIFITLYDKSVHICRIVPLSSMVAFIGLAIDSPVYLPPPSTVYTLRGLRDTAESSLGGVWYTAEFIFPNTVQLCDVDN